MLWLVSKYHVRPQYMAQGRSVQSVSHIMAVWVSAFSHRTFEVIMISPLSQTTYCVSTDCSCHARFTIYCSFVHGTPNRKLRVHFALFPRFWINNSPFQVRYALLLFGSWPTSYMNNRSKQYSLQYRFSSHELCSMRNTVGLLYCYGVISKPANDVSISHNPVLQFSWNSF